MKMYMIFKYLDGRPNERREYNTKKECDDHYRYILRHRQNEIKCLWIGRDGYGASRVDLHTKKENKHNV
jgi:hypothetical protein